MVILLEDILVPTDERANEAVQRLVQRVFNTAGPVETTLITGGITNQLLKAETADKKCLVRLFGKGTSTFIDREREYRVHLRLSELGMAAPLYCKFSNGLVYQWVNGTPATYLQLSERTVALAIAKKLGEWHARLSTADVPMSQTIYDLLDSWIPIAPEGILPLDGPQLKAELEWFKHNFARADRIVMGHNDLLCGNILIQGDGEVQFIDYEYSQQCPRAYDIANHFMEWQGYDCDTAKIPELGSELVGEWLAVYLAASKSPDSVDKLRTEISDFYGLPGFYWGLWAAIQSTQSDIDFDYRSYAALRFEEYSRWKRSHGHCSQRNGTHTTHSVPIGKSV